MNTSHSTLPRPAEGKNPSSRQPARRAAEPPAIDPADWNKILQAVRQAHPQLNRLWFDQMVPRQLTTGVIQVTVPTAAQLNFCQNQCQQPFTVAAQQVTG